MQTSYGFGKSVNYNYAEAIEKVTAALSEQGFGILTQIDIAATMKKKLDKDMLPHIILGACNPQLAHRAISAEPSIGLMLPCNVVVRETESGKVHIEIMDPNMMQDLVNKSEIHEVAKEARQRLERVLEAL